jgi:hypothetical protein
MFGHWRLPRTLEETLKHLTAKVAKKSREGRNELDPRGF